MTKDYHTDRKNQEKNKTSYRNPKVHRSRRKNRLNFNTWFARGAPMPKFSSRGELKGALETYNKNTLHVLEYFIYGDSRGIPMFMGQEHIGKKLGLCRQTVNRHVRRLYEDGWLDIYRRPNNSNVYKLTSIFRRKDIQEAFGYLLPVLRSLFLCLLSAYSITSPFPDHFNYSLYGNHFRNSATLSKNKENKNYIYKDRGLHNSQKGRDMSSNLVGNLANGLRTVPKPTKTEEDMRQQRTKQYQDMQSMQIKQQEAALRNQNYTHSTKGYGYRKQAAEGKFVPSMHNNLVKEAHSFSKERAVRQRVLEIENGTEYQKQNFAKAEANLQKIFGPNWRNTI